MSHTYDIKYLNTLGAAVNGDNLLDSRGNFSLGFGPNDRPLLSATISRMPLSGLGDDGVARVPYGPAAKANLPFVKMGASRYRTSRCSTRTSRSLSGTSS